MQDEEYQNIWKLICTQVKSYEGVDPTQTDAFFSRIHLQAFAEGFAMLTADNDFIKKWIEKHYLTLLKRALSDLYHTDFNIIIEVDEMGAVKTLKEAQREQPVEAPQVVNDHEAPAPSASQPNKESKLGGKDSSTSLPGHSKMTFENYIIGDSNRMAFSMATAVAEHPGQEHLNPLFIYGKSGVGKTHLLVAIKNYIDQASETGTGPLLKTVYVDSSEFINDYGEASAEHSREKTSFRSFKKRYEEADVLLIDDVQTFQGKRETLKIVFELFNKLTSQGKQIVMSADVAPKNIDIDERYQTRFNSGATFDIQSPEIETKLSIIDSTLEDQMESNNLRIDIPKEVREHIAEISSSNIRELKSAVTTILQHLIVSGENTITVDQAEKILEHHFSNDVKRLTIRDIQHEVESFYKVSHSELIGKSRRHSVAYARQIAMYVSRELLDETLASIGKAFGDRDHSTAKYSVDIVAERIREDKSIKDEVDIVIAQIRDR